jgi:uncharacterized repeat protein (TIGR01451 family)
LDGEIRVGTSTNPDAACFKGGNEMKKHWFAIAAASLIPTAVLCILLGILGRPGSGIEVVRAAPPDAPSSRASNRAPITKSVGISYDLHGFDAPYNADWGLWCETDITRSYAACADYGLLSSSFVTTVTHRGDNGVSLKLRYTVTQTNTLASYFEHLSIGDVYYDLSRLSEFRFWVKGEGNTISDTTTFWVRFADTRWYSGFYTITGASDVWQEKTIDLESLRKDPDWKDVNWRQMREVTIIFENDRNGSGRVANPLTGTLYFDLIGLTSPDSDPTFPDSLNNFIADWGYWCETETIGSNAACVDYGLLSSNVVTTQPHGGSGASLKLSYAVTQANTLASHYEHLYNSDTFYDLSNMGEFRFWVKGEGNTIDPDTTFWVRFADKEWCKGFYTITGVSGGWQEEAIPLESLKNAPGCENINWHQMREVTIIFENDRDGSGRVANPLAGTLYFDDLAFVDVETQADTDDQFLELLERRAFQYFWEYADPNTGLIRETAAEPDMSSIATVGFGLTSICAAKERGWITREAAYARVLTTLNSFYDDPNDPNDLVVSGTHGLFYHFVNMHDGTPMLADLDGVSTIDTALLMAGVLSVKQCFTETEIITRATAIYKAADWKWFLDPSSGLLTMCWTPQDEHPYQCWTTPDQRDDDRVWRWAGYNEAMILYLLAIGSPSPTYSISATSWISWASTYRWGAYYGYPVLVHGPSPLFAYQYSHAWVDFRGKRDDYANYFRNSRYATLANRAYCRDVWYPYPDYDLWGITTSHGPIAGTCSGKAYRIGIGYPPDHGNNDGTIAPTAAGGSIVFTPQESISTLRYMVDRYHQRLWGLHGLKDSLNAWCEPDWFDNDYMGIDVGAMLLMIENDRSGLVWDAFMRNQEIVEAMQAVGFTPDQTREPSWFYYREAEQYDDKSGVGIQIEEHDKAWGKKTLQIDPGQEPNPGNQAVYTFTVDRKVNNSVFFEIRYSEGVTTPTDTIGVYLDGVEKGSFSTDYTADDWNSFRWDEERINLGIVSPGSHTITLRLIESVTGSHGVNLDVFRLYTALDVTKQVDPNPVRPGALLTYTLSVTNTSGMTLTATITDTLPDHIIPGETSGGTITWTAVAMEPDGVWTETIVVTTDVGYVGPLTNVLRVTTEEGATGVYTETSMCGHYIYLPLLLKSYSPVDCSGRGSQTEEYARLRANGITQTPFRIWGCSTPLPGPGPTRGG